MFAHRLHHSVMQHVGYIEDTKDGSSGAGCCDGRSGVIKLRKVFQNGAISLENLLCVVDVLDIATKPTPLCSESFLQSNQPDSIPCTIICRISLFMHAIYSSVGCLWCRLAVEWITWLNKLTSTIMVLGRGGWACLKVEKMVKWPVFTIVPWYLAYLPCSTDISVQRYHLTECNCDLSGRSLTNVGSLVGRSLWCHC